MWPADARAFSRPAPKAREKRPGDEVVFLKVFVFFLLELEERRIVLLILYDAQQCRVFEQEQEGGEIRFHLRKSVVTFAKKIIKANGTFIT